MRAQSALIPTSPQRGEVKSECLKLIGIYARSTLGPLS
jgi:hypothetical protein